LRRWRLRAMGLMPGRRRLRRAIALDEAVVEVIRAGDALERDRPRKRGDASYLSRHRSGVDTCLFLDRFLERCLDKPLAYTDRGP